MPNTQPLHPEPDPDLLRRAQTGDEAAFGVIMRSHYERTFRLVYAIVRHEAHARDVCQEIWLTVWRELPKFRGDARFTTWLHRVAVNVFLDRKKARRRYAPLDETTLARRPSQEPSPEAEAMRAQAHGRVAAAVQRLPETLRVPLVLRYGSGLSYGEIAQTLRVREGTVASRLSRALAQLARELGSGVR